MAFIACRFNIFRSFLSAPVKWSAYTRVGLYESIYCVPLTVSIVSLNPQNFCENGRPKISKIPLYFRSVLRYQQGLPFDNPKMYRKFLPNRLMKMSETPVRNTKSFLLFSDISKNSGQNSVILKIDGFCRNLLCRHLRGIRHKHVLAKYIHFKNAFKTVLARSGAVKNSFLCFDHFLSFWQYDGRRVYDGGRLYSISGQNMEIFG